MSGTCKNSGLCGDVFKAKGCFCYAMEDDLDPWKNQFCGFEDTDGFVYGCDTGCCSSVCPNKNCPKIAHRKPEQVVAHMDFKVKEEPEPFPRILKLLLILLLILLTAASVFTLVEK